MASPFFALKIPSGHRITLVQIDAVVSARLGPTRGLGKSQPACFNRQVAMYLASHVGRWSTTVIGRFYGGRDHSTVVHSIQRIESMREIEPELDALLCDLKSKIVAGTEDNVEHKPQLVIRKPRPSDIEIRLLAKEIAGRVLDLLRKELRPTHEVRDFGGASQE